MKINNIIDYFLKYKKPEVLSQQAQTEGSTISEYETERFLTIKYNNGDYGKHFKINYKDFVMLDGLDKGWNYIFNNYDKEITLDVIKIINANVSDDTNQNPGIIRTENNIRVIIDRDTKYIPDLPNEEEIKQRLKEINQIDDPVKKSFELFTFISRGQFFENCNKRTAYLTANIPLIKKDLAILYPVEAINRDFLHILTSYYMNPDELNKKRCHRFLKENYLSNQELDKIREESGIHLIFEEEVDEILEKRKEYVQNRENRLKKTTNELMSKIKQENDYEEEDDYDM